MGAPPEPTVMVDEGLGNSSYLVDLGDGRGLLIDPARDVAPYLAMAERRGLRLSFTAETHLHADFVSGSAELAARGAQVLAPGAAELQLPHRPLRDGDEIDFGGLRLRALATPGHTPEHIAYLMLDGEQPVALFSGGSLLVGAMARTDLISPDRTEELARALWRSIHERILTLPDDLPVYPTHGAGSFCSAIGSTERVTTIGKEKATNAFLAAPSEDAFVEHFLAGLGSFPSYFLRLRDVNRQGPHVYGKTPTLTPLSPQQVATHHRNGNWIVDARSIYAFSEGHIPGSLSNALRGQFASWLGWLIPEGSTLVFVLDEDQDRDELVRQCLKVGYHRFAGELAGGMEAWRRAGFPEARVPLIGCAEVENRGATPLLDVRQRAEWVAGHIAGARHVELGSLARTQDIPGDPLMITCGHGERAMSAASLLEGAGHRDLSVLDGGVQLWEETKRPLVVGP